MSRIKIKHVLDPKEHLMAVYITRLSPYVITLPVYYFCLVERRDDDEEEYRSEILGYVLNGTIVPADVIDVGNTKFLGYQSPEAINSLAARQPGVKNWHEQVLEWQSWGKGWEAETRPIAPEVRRLWNEVPTTPNQPRRREPEPIREPDMMEELGDVGGGVFTLTDTVARGKP